MENLINEQIEEAIQEALQTAYTEDRNLRNALAKKFLKSLNSPAKYFREKTSKEACLTKYYDYILEKLIEVSYDCEVSGYPNIRELAIKAFDIEI